MQRATRSTTRLAAAQLLAQPARPRRRRRRNQPRRRLPPAVGQQQRLQPDQGAREARAAARAAALLIIQGAPQIPGAPPLPNFPPVDPLQVMAMPENVPANFALQQENVAGGARQFNYTWTPLQALLAGQPQPSLNEMLDNMRGILQAARLLNLPVLGLTVFFRDGRTGATRRISLPEEVFTAEKFDQTLQDLEDGAEGFWRILARESGPTTFGADGVLGLETIGDDVFRDRFRMTVQLPQAQAQAGGSWVRLSRSLQSSKLDTLVLGKRFMLTGIDKLKNTPSWAGPSDCALMAFAKVYEQKYELDETEKIIPKKNLKNIRDAIHGIPRDGDLNFEHIFLCAKYFDVSVAIILGAEEDVHTGEETLNYVSCLPNSVTSSTKNLECGSSDDMENFVSKFDMILHLRDQHYLLVKQIKWDPEAQIEILRLRARKMKHENKFPVVRMTLGFDLETTFEPQDGKLAAYLNVWILQHEEEAEIMDEENYPLPSNLPDFMEYANLRERITTGDRVEEQFAEDVEKMERALYEYKQNYHVVVEITGTAFNYTRFDGLITVGAMQRRGMLEGDSCLFTGNALLQLKLGRQFKFIDLCRFLPGTSLGKALKDFRCVTSKGFVNHNTVQAAYSTGNWQEFWQERGEELVEYCYTDVKGMLELYTKVRDTLRRLLGGRRLEDFLTLGHIVYDYWKNDPDVLEAGGLRGPSTQKSYDYFRGGLIGGRSFVLEPGEWEGGKYQSIDVNGMYGWMMENNLYPMGKEYPTMYEVEDKIGVYDIEVPEGQPASLPNILPRKVKGEPLDWNYKGPIKIRCSSVFLQTLKQFHVPYTVTRGKYFLGATDKFFTWMAPITALKLQQDVYKAEESDEYNPSERLLCKYTQNIPSGKGAQRQYTSFTRLLQTAADVQRFVRDGKREKNRCFMLEGCDALMATSEKAKFFYNSLRTKPIQLSLHTYALAHAHLYRGLLSRLPGQLATLRGEAPYIYGGDTDSLWVRLCPAVYEALDDTPGLGRVVLGNKPGEYSWELEGPADPVTGEVFHATKAVFVAAKMYAMLFPYADHKGQMSKERWKGVSMKSYTAPLELSNTKYLTYFMKLPIQEQLDEMNYRWQKILPAAVMMRAIRGEPLVVASSVLSRVVCGDIGVYERIVPKFFHFKDKCFHFIDSTTAAEVYDGELQPSYHEQSRALISPRGPAHMLIEPPHSSQ